MIRYLHITNRVISHDTGHDVTIYRDIPWISHTPDHLETTGTNPNSTKTHHLVAVYSCFVRFSLCPHLAVLVWPLLSFLCCPWAGHVIGLTLSSANSNIVPGLGLLPERMHVSFCFIFHFFHFFSFPVFFPSWYLILIPGTPYCSCEVPAILLLT